MPALFDDSQDNLYTQIEQTYVSVSLSPPINYRKINTEYSIWVFRCLKFHWEKSEVREKSSQLLPHLSGNIGVKLRFRNIKIWVGNVYVDINIFIPFRYYQWSSKLVCFSFTKLNSPVVLFCGRWQVKLCFKAVCMWNIFYRAWRRTYSVILDFLASIVEWNVINKNHSCSEWKPVLGTAQIGTFIVSRKICLM